MPAASGQGQVREGMEQAQPEGRTVAHNPTNNAAQPAHPHPDRRREPPKELRSCRASHDLQHSSQATALPLQHRSQATAPPLQHRSQATAQPTCTHLADVEDLPGAAERRSGQLLGCAVLAPRQVKAGKGEVRFAHLQPQRGPGKTAWGASGGAKGAPPGGAL